MIWSSHKSVDDSNLPGSYTMVTDKQITIYQLCTRWHTVLHPRRLESFYFLSVLFNALVICEDQSTGDGWMNECSWNIGEMTKT
jgi:hypothetical protein